MIEMLLAVCGSREALAARPPMHHMLSPISPLFLNEDDTAQLLLACEYGIPTDSPIMPTAGTTGPITLAGTLALANAEFLGTMTLAQSVKPGHAMPFFVDPVVADMRSAAALFAAPEVGILNAAICQLGVEIYGVPPQAIGLDSDGFTTGQALFQKAQNALFTGLAGGRLLIGAGAVEACMALSPVQLVIDDEIVAIARRWDAGMQVSDETLAVEAIQAVGPRGHFLMEEHTMRHLRSGELMTTSIFERDRRELWEIKGCPTQEDKARRKARDLLAKHVVPPLPGEALRELESIIRHAEAAR
jgi:trimethylamine--corrinoid protein Co-methyltransferase